MIDKRSPHKNYPLPDPQNIAREDVSRIADAFLDVDSDVFELETSVRENFEKVDTVSKENLRISPELVGVFDNELRDLTPNKYIKVNATGDGFETVERTGAPGGKKGQVLAKNSDLDYDFLWLDIDSSLKRQPKLYVANEDHKSSPNETVFFSDDVNFDNNSERPHPSLRKIQAVENILSDSDTTYIIKDKIENQDEDELDIASKTAFGRVKIGEGIEVEDGVISVPSVPYASRSTFGIVKIGEGLNVDNGVISAPALVHADHEHFGIIKPSEEDFEFQEDGSLALKEIKYKDAVIYQKARAKAAEGNRIILDPECAHYRAFINEDTAFLFDFSNLTEDKDIAFDLEIVSDSEFKIAFAHDIIWTRPCVGIFFGKIKIHFEKSFGADILFGDMTFIEEPLSKELTNYATEDIQNDYICHTTGATKSAASFFTNSNRYSDYSFRSITNEGIHQTDFSRSTYVTSLYFYTGDLSGEPSYFFIEGSVDSKNWIILYKIENAKPGRRHLQLTRRGFFKHYRVRTTTAITIAYMRWHGFQIQDDSFEIKKIMPLLTADSLNGYTITSSGKNEGELYNLTQNGLTYANFNTRDSNNEYWIKYELPEAQVVNYIDITAPAAPERFPLRFRIEASNDNVTWTLILEKSFLTKAAEGQTFLFLIPNETAYKYYKFIPTELAEAEFRIARFRLYYKSYGKLKIEKFVPILSQDSSNGYTVSASSIYSSSNLAFCAFDNKDTFWNSAKGDVKGAWLKVEFPSAVTANAVYMKARSDSYYEQAPYSFAIEASQDNEHFLTLKECFTSWYQGEEKIIEFENEFAYKYYRILIHSAQSGGEYTSLQELNFGKSFKQEAVCQ